MAAFSLGLAHSLSRYKLKFSPDKVDTMIVQAICKFLSFEHFRWQWNELPDIQYTVEPALNGH